MKKLLFLPVETVVRDLDPNLMLCFEALKRDYDVIVGSVPGVDQFSKKHGRGIMITKHWENSFPFPFDSKEREKFIYIGFHPEGLVFKDKYFGEKMNVTGKSEKLDLNFVYGEYQKKLLIEVNDKLSPLLKPVGHPKFDLLRPEYHYLYKKNADKLKRKYGPFILINTNFTAGNTASFYDAEYIERKNRESVQKWGKPLDPEEVKFLKERIAYYKSLVIAYLDMLKHITKKFPDVNFVLRPHPSENHDTYHKALSDIPNLKVIHKGSVIDWIIGSEAVLQTGCTTAIESWACKKPLIRYNPFDESEKFESRLPNQFGKKANNLSQLSDLIKRVNDGTINSQFEEQLQIAKPYIESIDGKKSVTRIMDCIDKLLDGKKTENLNLSRKPEDQFPFFKFNKKELTFEFLRSIRTTHWLMKLRHGEDGAAEKAARYQKNTGIRKRYLMKKMKQISKSEPGFNFSEINFKKVETDTYLLSRD